MIPGIEPGWLHIRQEPYPFTLLYIWLLEANNLNYYGKASPVIILFVYIVICNFVFPKYLYENNLLIKLSLSLLLSLTSSEFYVTNFSHLV